MLVGEHFVYRTYVTLIRRSAPFPKLHWQCYIGCGTMESERPVLSHAHALGLTCPSRRRRIREMRLRWYIFLHYSSYSHTVTMIEISSWAREYYYGLPTTNGSLGTVLLYYFIGWYGTRRRPIHLSFWLNIFTKASVLSHLISSPVQEGLSF